MKLKPLLEARYADRHSPKEAITNRLKEFILTKTPKELGFGENWKADGGWFFINARNQVEFAYSRHAYDLLVQKAIDDLGMNAVPEEVADDNGRVNYYQAESIIKKVLRSPEVTKMKNRFKGNFAASGQMAEALIQKLEQIENQIEELLDHKRRLEQQLKKIQK